MQARAILIDTAMSHLLEGGYEYYDCPSCDREYLDDGSNYMCQQCEEEYDDLDSLHQHEDDEHSESEYSYGDTSSFYSFSYY